jgi:MFS family permease
MASCSNADLLVSEIVGRKPIYCISLFFYFIFTLPSALAPNIGTMLAGRLVSAAFAYQLSVYEVGAD